MHWVSRNPLPLLISVEIWNALEAPADIQLPILNVECVERASSEVYYKQILQLNLGRATFHVVEVKNSFEEDKKQKAWWEKYIKRSEF